MAAFNSATSDGVLAFSLSANPGPWVTEYIHIDLPRSFRTPREDAEWNALMNRWRRECDAQARLDWLRARRALGWARESERRPAPRPRRTPAPWPMVMLSWRMQTARMRKGSRLSTTPPRRTHA